MVAVNQPRSISLESEAFFARSSRSFELLQGSLSTRKIARHSPRVASIHRIVDGALLGTCVAVTVISALTLHWQHRWTVAFTRLEMTRSLTHRLTESTATLENYLSKSSRLPGGMVPTKASDLLYLDHPLSEFRAFEIKKPSLINSLLQIPLRYGY